MTALRVILAEDDVLLREGLASLLLRSGFEVVGQAGDASQLLTIVREPRFPSWSWLIFACRRAIRRERSGCCPRDSPGFP